ncbi:hypothetical protein HOL21_01855 [Candidatus Woesearchaeota archaeon]|jgi:hypothetical protein|nr:hypothetical protein [Candidatus Woesearchaeota archaeon]MBT5396938.1 hypothetical protein [Candidatus Woesearchaeota archaeon]MBT5924902.1 hypothetical protein [Candidatus Woesearchaeota archaeon]MBT6367131.1 hypothetical protein [Candidatus Woesearchaeota archaeon]MBT7762295.1 hypothetical protein [Candidatus Woesearchaeota archaeon]
MTIATESARMLGNATGPSLESNLGYNMVAAQPYELMQKGKDVKVGGSDYLSNVALLETLKAGHKPLYDKVGGDQPILENIGINSGNIKVDTRVYGISLDGKLADPYISQ